VFGYLMVSTVKYPDFKGQGEKIRVIPAGIAVAVGCFIIVTYTNALLFAPFFAYAIFGILNTAFAMIGYKSATL